MIEIPAKVTKFLGSTRMSNFLKLAILLTAFSFIYAKLNGLSDFLNGSKEVFFSSWDLRSSYFIWVLILFPVNYLLEALKWKWLLRNLSPITVWAGFKAVFSGLTLGFITPHSIGDYAGRILFLPQHVRISTILPLFIGRFAQFVITVLFGCIALGYVYVQTSDIQLFDMNILVFFLPISLLAPVILFLVRRRIWQLLKKWLPIHFVQQLSIGIDAFTISEIGITLVICFLRYSVFVYQYVLILFFFGFPGHDWQLFTSVALIFLAKSTLPTFNFMSDLGVREFAALIFLNYTQMSDDVIVLASLTLWFINILLPTVIGLIFVQQIKLLDKK